MEEVVLGLDARVLDHGPGVGLQAGHGATNVTVDFDDFLDRGGFEEWTGYALFYADYDAIAGSYLGGVGQFGTFFYMRGWGVFWGRITPMAVEPSLIASREYSTWKRRPSGEKVLSGY